MNNDTKWIKPTRKVGAEHRRCTVPGTLEKLKGISVQSSYIAVGGGIIKELQASGDRFIIGTNDGKVLLMAHPTGYLLGTNGRNELSKRLNLSKALRTPLKEVGFGVYELAEKKMLEGQTLFVFEKWQKKEVLPYPDKVALDAASLGECQDSLDRARLMCLLALEVLEAADTKKVFAKFVEIARKGV